MLSADAVIDWWKDKGLTRESPFFCKILGLITCSWWYISPVADTHLLFSELLVFGEMLVILGFRELLGLITFNRVGAQPKRRPHEAVAFRRVRAR